MDPAATAIELTEAAWEQWVGAVLRAERFRRLTTAQPPRRRPVAAARGGLRTRGSLVWMLAISAAGFLLLR